MTAAPSYVHGEADPPLLGETIGAASTGLCWVFAPATA